MTENWNEYGVIDDKTDFWSIDKSPNLSIKNDISHSEHKSKRQRL